MTLSLKETLFSIGLIALFLSLGSVARADYYISVSGDDGNSGLSAASPWRTIERINKVNIPSGTRILFKGGEYFSGTLRLNRSDLGTAAKPIIIGSYGSGRATIWAANETGIYAYNTAGIRIANLRILGAGWKTNKGHGIHAYVDLPGNIKLDTLIIDNVEVAGFGTGINIGGWNGTTGFKNITIWRVVVHDNRERGIGIWGYDIRGHRGFSHQKVHIAYANVYGNSGSQSVGNGIVVSNIDSGIIERSVAHHNGLRNTTKRGPFGIWAWRANRITIQHNESYANRTATGGTEGGGFDLDGGMTNSVMQFNYSHDNDGPGFVFAQYKDALPFSNNAVRYNITVNDGRRNSAGSIQVWSYAPEGIRSSRIHNNTVYVTDGSSSNPIGIAIISRTADLLIANNVVVTAGGAPLLSAVAGQTRMRVVGNGYWGSGAAFRVIWSGREYKSLGAFRLTGQEVMNGRPTGVFVDPKLRRPGARITFNNASFLERLWPYQLAAGSPLIDLGVGVNTATSSDYFGSPVPIYRRLDVGAHEYAGSAASVSLAEN